MSRSWLICGAVGAVLGLGARGPAAPLPLLKVVKGQVVWAEKDLPRRVPLEVAAAAGVRFTADLNGRPAVLARLTALAGEPRAVHGRHLHDRRGEGKMFTVGRSGGLGVSSNP